MPASQRTTLSSVLVGGKASGFNTCGVETRINFKTTSIVLYGIHTSTCSNGVMSTRKARIFLSNIQHVHVSSNKVILQLASAPVFQFECQQMVVNEPADSHTLQRHTKKRRINTRTVWSQNDAAPDFTPSAVGGTNMQWELTGKFSKLESNKVNFDTIDMHTAEEDMVSENAVFDDNLSSQAGSMGRQVGIFAIRNHPILCFYLQERLHSARNDAFSNIVHAMATFANSATQLNTIIDNFLAVTRELTAEFEYNISTTPAAVRGFEAEHDFENTEHDGEDIAPNNVMEEGGENLILWNFKPQS